ncbi:hypothetical protein DFH09DRAFT_1177648, partial [Mycena vulgaris]
MPTRFQSLTEERRERWEQWLREFERKLERERERDREREREREREQVRVREWEREWERELELARERALERGELELYERALEQEREREREQERERGRQREWEPVLWLRKPDPEREREQREREQREQERLLRQVQLQQRLEAPPGACPGGLSLNYLSSLKIDMTFSVSSRASGPCSRACGVVYVPWITGYHSGVSVAHYRACGDHAVRWRSFRVHATRGRPPHREPCGQIHAASTLGQALPAGLRDQDDPATGSSPFLGVSSGH